MILDKSFKTIWDYLKDFKQQLPEMLFLKRNQLANDIIGIDIGSRFIKILKIKKTDKNYFVEMIAHVPVTQGVVQNGEINDYELVGNLITDALAKSGVNSKNVAICIPRSCAIVKNITVNKYLNKDEIESRVWVDVQHLFPNIASDIYLDYSVIGPSAKDPDQLDLILVACRKEQLNPYLEVMRAAKLNTRLVDINSFALERSLTLIAKQVPELKTVALLNISLSWIDLVVVTDGNLVYTHELNYDGSDIVNSIKPAKDANDDEAIQHNIEVLRHTIGLHLRHSMQFFYSSRPNTRIERIYLVGDSAVAIPMLKDYIQQETGKEIKLGNPFLGMELAPNLQKDQVEKIAPAFMLCCGLALSKIN